MLRVLRAFSFVFWGDMGFVVLFMPVTIRPLALGVFEQVWATSTRAHLLVGCVQDCNIYRRGSEVFDH